jgi:enoyl reductase-like protein
MAGLIRVSTRFSHSLGLLPVQMATLAPASSASWTVSAAKLAMIGRFAVASCPIQIVLLKSTTST